ncbi:MAG: response regulator [Deltaproteobacteria bacterium]|nr:MAG: response regulator [Deltaproteobacteria bacterium]
MAEIIPRVLIVDDERFFRDAIRETLAEVGIDAESVSSGKEALAAVGSSDIAVVVLDVTLDDMSGIEVLRQLRDIRPSTQVIMLSASADQDLVLEALRLDASDYLAKPLHDEELVLSVRRALAVFDVGFKWRHLRERIGRLDELMASLHAEADRASELGVDAGLAAFADAAVIAAADLLDASKTSLLILDEEANELLVAAATGSPLAATEMDPVALGEGVAGVALSLGESVLVDDVYTDDRFTSRTDRGDQYESSSLAVVPLRDGHRPLGVICATDRVGGAPFGQDELALLGLLARPVAHFLAHSRDDVRGKGVRAEDPGDVTAPLEDDLLVTEANSGRDAEMVREICEVITLEVEPQRVMDGVMRIVARRLPASLASLYLIDNITGELVLEGQGDMDGSTDRERLPRSTGLTATVLQTGGLVATDDPGRDPRFVADVDTAQDGEVRPLLCVPLRMRGKVLGLVRAFPTVEAGRAAHRGELLTAVLSAAVRNVLLYRSLLESIDEVADARRERGGGGF